MGDGVLASFQSISDASYCAGALLSDIKRIDGLNLKIGIHLGDVVVEGREIYGNGVNIASRIQTLVRARRACLNRCTGVAKKIHQGKCRC